MAKAACAQSAVEPPKRGAAIVNTTITEVVVRGKSLFGMGRLKPAGSRAPAKKNHNFRIAGQSPKVLKQGSATIHV